MRVFGTAVASVAVWCGGLTPAWGQATLLQQNPTATPVPVFSDFAHAFSNQQLDNFAVPLASNVLSVQVWGTYAGDVPPAADDFRVRFFEGSSGTPFGTFAQEFTTAPSVRETTGMVAGGLNVYRIVLDLPAPFTAYPGNQYFLSVVNNTSATAADDRWHWLKSSDGDNMQWNRGGGPASTGAWSLQAGDMAFLLSGIAPVPEPGSLALLGAVAAGWLATRRLLRGARKA